MAYKKLSEEETKRICELAAKEAADEIRKDLMGTKYLAIFEKMDADGLFEKKTSPKTKRIMSENYRVRFKIFKRDGFKCQYCGRSPKTDRNVVLHLDHIKPKSKGGDNSESNLTTACLECNIGKNNIEL